MPAEQLHPVQHDHGYQPYPIEQTVRRRMIDGDAWIETGTSVKDGVEIVHLATLAKDASGELTDIVRVREIGRPELDAADDERFHARTQQEAKAGRAAVSVVSNESVQPIQPVEFDPESSHNAARSKVWAEVGYTPESTK